MNSIRGQSLPALAGTAGFFFPNFIFCRLFYCSAGYPISQKPALRFFLKPTHLFQPHWLDKICWSQTPTTHLRQVYTKILQRAQFPTHSTLPTPPTSTSHFPAVSLGSHALLAHSCMASRCPVWGIEGEGREWYARGTRLRKALADDNSWEVWPCGQSGMSGFAPKSVRMALNWKKKSRACSDQISVHF